MGNLKSDVKVGDRVRNNGTSDYDLTHGKVYEVIRVEWNGELYPVVIVKDDIGDENYLWHDEYEIATEATPKASPKVSDFTGTIDGSGYKRAFDVDDHKLPLHLIPPQFSEGIAEVLQHGIKKYAKNQWAKGMSWEDCMGAVLRHLSAFRKGEDIDPDSGLPHIHHAACGLMMLSTFAHGPRADEYKQFDDRVWNNG